MKGRSRPHRFGTKSSDKSARARGALDHCRRASTAWHEAKCGRMRVMESGPISLRSFQTKIRRISEEIGRTTPWDWSYGPPGSRMRRFCGVDQRARQGYGFADGIGVRDFDNWTVATDVLPPVCVRKARLAEGVLRGRSARRNFRSAGDSHWLRTWRIADIIRE